MPIEEANNKSVHQVILIILGLCLSLFIIFYIFKEPKSNIVIYNPFTKKISIEFDQNGEAIFLEPATHTKVFLKLAEHQLLVQTTEKVLLDEEIFVSQKIKDNGGFINLTGEDLVIFEERYGDDAYNAQNLDAEDFYFRIIPASERIIAKDWDFEIYEGLPDQISVRDDGSYSFRSYKKLATLSNFKKYAGLDD